MKRLIAFVLLFCLVFCGCGGNDTDSTEKPSTESSSVSATESTPSTPSNPTASSMPHQTAPQKVTVYLLTKLAIFDSGYTEYVYDENHNIKSYKVYTIENDVMCEVFFEDRDSNQMPRKIRTVWPDGVDEQAKTLAYNDNGRLKEEREVGSNFCGYQYDYDDNGNLTEAREYYDAILQTVVRYEYNGNTLKSVYCEDNAGKKVFECRVENGLIIEKNYFDANYDYGYKYKYDKNNNLTETSFIMDGETLPGDQYTYKAVEVDASRAKYLIEQQNYLITIA